MSCEFKPSCFFLTTGDWKPTKSFLFRILSFQFRFLAKFRPWKKNKKALPNVCARRKTVQQLPTLRRARDLSALLPQPRLLSAELKKKGNLPEMVSSSSAELYWINFAYSSCSSSHLQFEYSNFWIACFCIFFGFLGFTLEKKLEPMASLKVYGKAYSANVTRVLTTLAEKNVDDYQMVPIDLLTGANKTPEYLKLQVLAASPPTLFHLSSPLEDFEVYYSSWGVVLCFCSTRAIFIFFRKNHLELSWEFEDLMRKLDCGTVTERQVVVFSGRLESVKPRAAYGSR